MSETQRVLPDKFYAPVLPDRAEKAAKRYRNLQFRQAGETPTARIPADPDDDDLVLSQFIEQHKSCFRSRLTVEVLQAALVVLQQKNLEALRLGDGSGLTTRQMAEVLFLNIHTLIGGAE